MTLQHENARDEDLDERPASRPARGIPWAIWIVVLMLGLEGIGNLLAIAYRPGAAGWLAFKCLAIVGLIRGWRLVFVLTLIVAAQHVVAFGAVAPLAAFLNLVIVVLVASSFRHFFTKAPPGDSPDVLKPPVREVSGWEADA